MSSITDFTALPPIGKKAVLLFWAPWHEASTSGGPLDQVLNALASTAGDDVVFGRVEAEACSTVSEKYQVTAVPTFILLNAEGAVVERIEGGDDVAVITQAVQRLLHSPDDVAVTEAALASPEEQLNKRLARLVRSSDVMLFIKGTPSAPRCGFSRQAVALLQDDEIPFGSFDILSDEAVRQGLKKYSDWPTYPQLYVNGELIGGLDIMKEMHEAGSLKDQLGITGSAPQPLEERLSKLIRRHKIMLFMKGLPSAPKCGFSRQMVEILNEENVPYDTFDILMDEEVRQGLKTFSNWPTYPQLYVNGELIGGLDIVKELREEGSLKEALGCK